MSPRIDIPLLVRIHYRMRTISFAMMFVATSLHIHGTNYSPIAWILLVLLFFVYPHFQYWWVRRAEDPIKVALKHLLVDSVLLGMYAAAMQLSLIHISEPTRPY